MMTIGVKMEDNTSIKEQVRERYAEEARRVRQNSHKVSSCGGAPAVSKSKPSCCGSNASAGDPMVPLKSSGGSDSHALDRPGPLEDNRGKRAREESAHGRRFISVPSFSAMKPPEDSERIRIDSIPVMASRCRPDGFVEFFNRRWLEYTGLSLDQALGWEWTVAIHADDLNQCEHSI